MMHLCTTSYLEFFFRSQFMLFLSQTLSFACITLYSFLLLYDIEYKKLCSNFTRIFCFLVQLIKYNCYLQISKTCYITMLLEIYISKLFWSAVTKQCTHLSERFLCTKFYNQDVCILSNLVNLLL